MPGDLFKSRTRHPNEALASRRVEFGAFPWSRNIALDKYVAGFGKNGCRTLTVGTELGECAVLPYDFCDFHLFLLFLVNQNYAFCFIFFLGGAIV